MTRDERLAALLAEYPPSDPASLPDDVPPYVLIEQSVFDGSYFVTAHRAPKHAAHYIDHQEEPQDWQVVTLVDIESGTHYRPDTRTRFLEVKESTA